MLASLTIRNFVLIEDAAVEFDAGLNVLTGETGAGKTLLTRALGLLMGERAEEGLVGPASSEALVQAVFDLSESEAREIPADVTGLLGDVGPGELIVTRRLGRDGRNRNYVNDTAVTLGMMGAVVGALLSFAGQHEYRRLLDPRYQLEVLDRWAGADVVELAAEFRAVHQDAQHAERVLRERRGSEESRVRELELLRYQVRELDQARLSHADEEALLSEQRVLSRAEELLRGAGAAANLLADEEGASDVGTLLAQAAGQLGGLAGVDPALDGLLERLAEVRYLVADVARDLHGYAGRVSVDPARLEEVDERLRLYTDLARKYGGSTGSALQYLKEATARLEALECSEDDLVRLEEARAASAARALELAGLLSGRRQASVPFLEKAVADQLAGLGMADAAICIAMQTTAGWEGLGQSGAESVEFLLRANTGQPPRSLSRTASGGELSRVLLAIKCALAGAGGSETLVFDEIDAGIGGRTAVAVANKLRGLADGSQLIVVTHLAQVAAVADRHYVIDKAAESGATVARLSRLDEEAVVEELCRMLGGRPGDAEAMAHARELRDRAADGLLD